MSDSKKFDVKKFMKLNNPERLEWVNPDLVLKTLELKNPKTIIDIGSGTGIFARAFAKRMPDTTIYACDSADVMIDWMNENLTENNIKPMLTSENSINLENNIADLIYMITVHHELLNPEKMLKETYRLLKPNGKIAIIDWKKSAEQPIGPSFEKRIPENTIMEQLKNTGFNNILSHNIFPLHSFVVGQK